MQGLAVTKHKIGPLSVTLWEKTKLCNHTRRGQKVHIAEHCRWLGLVIENPKTLHLYFNIWDIVLVVKKLRAVNLG